MDTWCDRKNEPKTNPIKAKTNPIKANLKNGQMTVSAIITKEYEKMSTWAIYENKANFNPKQTQFQRQRNAAAFDEVIAAHTGWPIK